MGWTRYDIDSCGVTGNVVRETLFCVRDGRVVRRLQVVEEQEGARDLSQQVARVEAGRKKPLGRLRRRWKDNIKMDLKEMKWRGLDSSGTGKGQVGGSCECCNEPWIP